MMTAVAEGSCYGSIVEVSLCLIGMHRLQKFYHLHAAFINQSGKKFQGIRTNKAAMEEWKFFVIAKLFPRHQSR